jgi:hypothetical protein
MIKSSIRGSGRLCVCLSLNRQSSALVLFILSLNCLWVWPCERVKGRCYSLQINEMMPKDNSAWLHLESTLPGMCGYTLAQELAWTEWEIASMPWGWPRIRTRERFQNGQGTLYCKGDGAFECHHRSKDEYVWNIGVPEAISYIVMTTSGRIINDPDLSLWEWRFGSPHQVRMATTEMLFEGKGTRKR